MGLLPSLLVLLALGPAGTSAKLSGLESAVEYCVTSRWGYTCLNTMRRTGLERLVVGKPPGMLAARASLLGCSLIMGREIVRDVRGLTRGDVERMALRGEMPIAYGPRKAHGRRSRKAAAKGARRSATRAPARAGARRPVRA